MLLHLVSEEGKNPFSTWVVTPYPAISLGLLQGKLGAQFSGTTQQESPVADTAPDASVLPEPPKYGNFNGVAGGIISKKHVIRAFILTFRC